MIQTLPRTTFHAGLVLLLCLLALASCQREPAGRSSSLPPAEGAAAPAAKDNPAPPPTYDLPAGATLQVRLDQQLDTARNRAGDAFTATLDKPVMDTSRNAIPKGTLFKGHVTSASPSGRLKGRGHLTVTLDSFMLNGQTYRVETSSSTRVSGTHKKRNVTLIGGGGGVGAVVGAIAGGGTGAAIGAAAGAGAGTAGAALTGRKHVVIPVEAVVKFTLKTPVQIPAS
jgi:hypothetical protein